MHAETPLLHFQTLFQLEVFGIIYCVSVTMAIRLTFFIFWTKSHKIVEILAILTTKLSSFKMHKVGMLFCYL